jgi:hypothetical protein
MIFRQHMHGLAEPLRRRCKHNDRRGSAAGGKRVSAQPLTPSTEGMLDGGEGAVSLAKNTVCIGPFAHGDQALRAQGSRGPVAHHDAFISPIPSTTRVRNSLGQHNRK